MRLNFMAEMHYTSIPYDLSSDSVSTLHTSYESPGKVLNDSSSLNGPLLCQNYLYSGEKNRKEPKDRFKVLRKYSEFNANPQNFYDNFGSTVTGKTNSLPRQCNQGYTTPSITVATSLQAEDLATQLTLLDGAVFRSIKPEELTSCSWNKKNKLLVAPNVVSFTRRFNHVSFWTVQEILNGLNPKQRAETILHFIRIAKKLYDLNNLHSLFAIICGLRSASIYRLDKTWAYLSKKDKAIFDKLVDVFSDKNNWGNLREHMDMIKLPCIPYLGVFLTDLVYIDMAHPVSKNAGNHQRTLKMNTVLEKVKIFQSSVYLGIEALPEIQRYLNNVRYIEELQKFLEDDHFKLSMKLEPNSPVPSSSSSSKESVGDAGTGVAALSLSPAKGYPASFHGHPSNATKFVPGHRKCRSLGSNIFWKAVAVPLESNQVTVRHLLDDSVLEEPHLTTGIVDLDQNSLGSPSDTVNEDCSLISKTSSTLTVLPCEMDGSPETRCVMQSAMRRKVVLRDGRKPAVSTWQRYWVQLWATSIVYFSSKCFKGHSRSDFKREPHKMVSILGWIVDPLDDASHLNTFLLTDPKKATVYKFKAQTHELADQWIKALRLIVRGETTGFKPIPTNLMSFE